MSVVHLIRQALLVARREIGGSIAVIDAWRCRSHERRSLIMMNDRDLRDIGVTRYEADHEARKPFWRA